jgi:hypothetical protein
MPAYYFDVLPLRPYPETFESLTSYLMRLAEKNGLHRFSSLHELIAVTAYSTSQLTDYSFSFLKVLADRVNCSESRLLITTMYYLGRKFSRTNSHTLSSFFKGSLGEYLRYCPLCISEKSYYNLTWRFLVLKGCSVHGRRFLDSCGLCGKSIPLFVLPAKIGICPYCSRDLRYCRTSVLSEKEMEEVKLRAGDLEYLLSPQYCEQKDSVQRAIGLQLEALRQEKHISREQAARELALPLSSFKFLEWEHTEKSGWSLQWNQAQLQMYFAYADYLGTSLKSLFTLIDTLSSTEQEMITLDAPAQADCIPLIRFQLREKELYRQVEQAAQSLKARQVEVTLSSISRHLHISLPTLRRYPAVMALVSEKRSRFYL